MLRPGLERNQSRLRGELSGLRSRAQGLGLMVISTNDGSETGDKGNDEWEVNR